MNRAEVVSRGYLIVNQSDPEYHVMTQHTIDGKDKEIFFGPLSSSLYNLFDMGFHLEVAYNPKWMDKSYGQQKKIPLRLVRGPERYVITRQRLEKFFYCGDLSGFVRAGVNLLPRFSQYEKPIVPQERDPLDTLLEKYRPKPKPKMIGNRTLREYISDELSYSLS